MAVSVDDTVRVGVIFGGRAKVRPVWFVWNGREVRVREVTYTWRSREGRSAILHFAVSDGANAYELRYDTEGLQWTLAGVEAS